MNLDYTSPPQDQDVHVALSFHERLLAANNLAKRGISISTRVHFVGKTQRPSPIFFFIASSHWFYGHRKEAVMLYPLGVLPFPIFREIGEASIPQNEVNC